MNSLLTLLTSSCSFPEKPVASGVATICYRIGHAAPVQVSVSLVSYASNPESLALAFYDPVVTPVSFLMTLGIEGFYLGPGEYKGGVQDVQVGIGIVQADGSVPVWTAAQATLSDLTTYVVPAGALVGTCTVSGLVPGPLFGPPDDPPPAGQPDLQILFCYFSTLSTIPGEG